MKSSPWIIAWMVFMGVILIAFQFQILGGLFLLLGILFALFSTFEASKPNYPPIPPSHPPKPTLKISPTPINASPQALNIMQSSGMAQMAHAVNYQNFVVTNDMETCSGCKHWQGVDVYNTGMEGYCTVNASSYRITDPKDSCSLWLKRPDIIDVTKEVEDLFKQFRREDESAA